MNYIVIIEAKEYEPVSSDTLIEWVEDGRILPETQVRNSMMNKWRKAIDYDFLADAFVKQKAEFEQNIPIKKRDNAKYLNKMHSVEKDRSLDESLTAFKNLYLPDPAPISLRLLATLFDYILIGCVIACFFVLADFAGISFDMNLNLTPQFYLFAFFFIVFFLTYYFVSLGGFAQTFGMWFWGILLVCNGEKAKPVYWGRAFLYTLLMLFFGIVSPFAIYISGRSRALHDIFSGTQVVRISARPK
jgi:uncharacterized RDD family membrane protein YckC